MSAEPPVFADLDPQRVLDALQCVSLYGDGRILQLNSYENRVFQVMLEDGGAVVAKFYRPARWTDEQILEEHRFSAELETAEIPVVAPLTLVNAALGDSPVQCSGTPATLATLTTDAGTHRYAVTPRRAGRAPEFDQPGTLRWIGRFIGRLHAVGAREPFAHRLTLDISTLGIASRNWLVENDVIPPDALPSWRAACDAALDEAQRLFDDAGDIRHLRLHGDCHPGNVLWTSAGPHFVDLDDACNGPAVQDLWMLLPGEGQAMHEQFDELLSGYTDFMDFDPRERRLVEALRTLRMIHHSAWIARRWSDPAFPIAFPWFEGTAYWHQQARQLRDQVEAMRAATEL